MTVKELMQELEKLPATAQVRIEGCDCSDIACRTEVYRNQVMIMREDSCNIPNHTHSS